MKAIKYIPVFLMLLMLPGLGYGEQPDSTAIDWTGFGEEADSAIECAKARTDAKFGIKEYMQTLDSLIVELHSDYVKKYKLKIASLISVERRDRRLTIKALVELIAQKHAGLIIAVWDDDTENIDRFCRELKLLQNQLAAAVVKLRNIKQN